MADFTPGPWKIINLPNASCIGIVPAKRPAGVSARDLEDIATINKMGEQYDAVANANLIVAVHDLLAVAERVANGGWAYPSWDRELAAAAVAKARGK